MIRFLFKATAIRGLFLVIGLSGAGVVLASTAATPLMVADSGMALMDTTTTATISEKLMNESILKKSDIIVSTAHGAVTLEGSASSTTAKAVAEAIARSVDGVDSVQNNLHVTQAKKDPTKISSTATNTKRVVTDGWITTKVKSEILANSLTKGFDVSVETSRGAVVLKGVLVSQVAIDQVKDIALKVEGVTSVDIGGLTIAVK